jgi:diguanylate cyclase (GGDEF)-like protein
MIINRHTQKEIQLLVYNIAPDDQLIELNFLRSEDIPVLISENKQETMSLLRSHEIGALLTYNRSDNNYEINFLRYIMQQHPNIQRIFLAQNLNSKLMEYAINKAHINYFLALPFTTSSLVDVIRKAFKRYIYVSRPYEKIDELIEYVQMFKQEAHTDKLTQLFNRRSFDDIMERAFELYQKKKIPVTLILLDIDHFKKLNDSYGHQAGDEVLRVLGFILKDSSRAEDSVFRYGGEEFAVVAHGDSTEKIQLFVDRILQKVRDTVVIFENKEIRFTISAGIETLTENLSMDQLIRNADAALYFAKSHGRDQVIVFKSDMLALLK